MITRNGTSTPSPTCPCFCCDSQCFLVSDAEIQSITDRLRPYFVPHPFRRITWIRGKLPAPKATYKCLSCNHIFSEKYWLFRQVSLRRVRYSEFPAPVVEHFFKVDLGAMEQFFAHTVHYYMHSDHSLLIWKFPVPRNSVN